MTGSYPGHTDLPVRIEATASAGTVTSFAVVFPCTNREPSFPQATGYLNAVLVIIFSSGPIPAVTAQDMVELLREVRARVLTSRQAKCYARSSRRGGESYCRSACRRRRLPPLN